MSNDSLKKKIDSLSTSKFKLSDLQSDKEGLRALAAERFMRKIRNKAAYAAKQRSHHHPPKEVEIPISQSTTEKLREMFSTPAKVSNTNSVVCICLGYKEPQLIVCPACWASDVNCVEYQPRKRLLLI
jgi:hypothetical protein